MTVATISDPEQITLPKMGVPVASVEPGSQADRNGLRKDDIIYAVEWGSGGFVTLSTGSAGEGDVLASCCYADSLVPCSEGRRPEFSIRVGGNEMAAGVERVVDGGVSG